MFYCLDRDILASKLVATPGVYYPATQNGAFMNMKTILSWVIRTCYQSCVTFFFPVIIYSSESVHRKGSPADFTMLSMVIYTTAVVVQSLTIITESNTVTSVNGFVVLSTFVGYFAIMSVANIIPQFKFFEVMFRLYGDPTYWLTVLLTAILALLPVYIIKVYNYDSTKLTGVVAAPMEQQPLLSDKGHGVEEV